MKKYLHILHSFSFGGITALVKNLVKLNPDFDTEHEVLLLQENADNAQLNQHIYTLIDKGSYSGKLVYLLKLCKNYDAVFVHSAKPEYMIPLLLAGHKIFLFQHGMSVSSGNPLRKLFYKKFYGFVSVVISGGVISSTKFAISKSRYSGINLRDKDCRLINFGIPVKELDDPMQSKENSPDSSKIIIGYAGRLVGQKQAELILNSLVNYEGTKIIDLKIAGDGPKLNQLKGIAKGLNKEKINVDFLGRVDDMRFFYNALDLFILPSRDESLGLVVLEALVHQVPVIVFDFVGGILEYINEDYGIIILKNENELKELFNNSTELLNRINEAKSKISVDNLMKFDISETRKQLDKLI